MDLCLTMTITARIPQILQRKITVNAYLGLRFMRSHKRFHIASKVSKFYQAGLLPWISHFPVKVYHSAPSLVRMSLPSHLCINIVFLSSPQPCRKYVMFSYLSVCPTCQYSGLIPEYIYHIKYSMYSSFLSIRLGHTLVLPSILQLTFSSFTGLTPEPVFTALEHFESTTIQQRFWGKYFFEVSNQHPILGIRIMFLKCPCTGRSYLFVNFTQVRDSI